MSVIASIISYLKYIRHNDFFEHELTKGLSMDSFLVTNKCQFGLLSTKPFSIFFPPMRALQRWKLMFSEDTVTVLASRNRHCTLMADDRTQNVCCCTILFPFFYKVCGRCRSGSYIIQHIPGAIKCSCFFSCFHLFKRIFPAIWALLIFIIDWCRYASEILKNKVRKVP